MRKGTKILGVLLALSMLTGCGKRRDINIVNISVLNSKPEIQKNIELAAQEFSEQYPEIRVKVVQYSRSQEVKDKMGSMRNQGTTPTMMIVDPLYIQGIKEELVPLGEEKWNEDMQVTMGEASVNQAGELIAFPFALECMGFIYNEEVMKEAGIDVTQIRTREKLEEAFKKVEATGRDAVVISNEDWSLANHFLTTAFTVQSQDGEEVLRYIEALREGKVDLKTDAKINGLLDTFDLMKAHNAFKENPLLPTFEKCAEVLANKEAGFWYMGNWASSNLNQFTKSGEKFGFIPVPVSNDASDFANQNIMGTIKYLVIDQNNNSPEQQEAAKRFLDWLVYEEAGKHFMVNEAGLIPGAISGEVNYEDSLAQSIQAYQEKGEVLEQVMAYLPNDNIASTGALMRQYLDGKIDRGALLDGVERAWKK